MAAIWYFPSGKRDEPRNPVPSEHGGRSIQRSSVHLHNTSWAVSEGFLAPRRRLSNGPPQMLATNLKSIVYKLSRHHPCTSVCVFKMHITTLRRYDPGGICASIRILFSSDAALTRLLKHILAAPSKHAAENHCELRASSVLTMTRVDVLHRLFYRGSPRVNSQSGVTLCLSVCSARALAAVGSYLWSRSTFGRM